MTASTSSGSIFTKLEEISDTRISKSSRFFVVEFHRIHRDERVLQTKSIHHSPSRIQFTWETGRRTS